MPARPLTPDEAHLYVAIRREMLADSPWAFGSSPSQDRRCDPDSLRASLAEPEYAILAAFTAPPAEPALLAVAGVIRDPALKRRHIAGIFGVYVTPTARGRGLGRDVVSAAIATARTWPGVEQVQLSVSNNAPAARALYDSLGFIPWGVEPDCLRIDGRSYSEVHMSLRL
jgi:RimJ/RimL family protein N-acetyltransferase